MNAYVPGAHRRVQPGYELLDRAVRRRVVLDLHQADDVGVHRLQRADLLRLLAVELELSVRSSRRRETAAEAVAVEEVEDVERGDSEVAADRVRCGRPRIRRSERDWADGLHPVRREALVEHAVETIHRVARAERVRSREPAGGIDRRVDVLLVVAVIEDERPAPVQVLLRDRRRAGRRHRCRRVETAPLGEADLAEASERERLVRGERLREVHAHALVALEVTHCAHG